MRVTHHYAKKTLDFSHDRQCQHCGGTYRVYLFQTFTGTGMYEEGGHEASSTVERDAARFSIKNRNYETTFRQRCTHCGHYDDLALEAFLRRWKHEHLEFGVYSAIGIFTGIMFGLFALVAFAGSLLPDNVVLFGSPVSEGFHDLMKFMLVIAALAQLLTIAGLGLAYLGPSESTRIRNAARWIRTLNDPERVRKFLDDWNKKREGNLQELDHPTSVSSIWLAASSCPDCLYKCISGRDGGLFRPWMRQWGVQVAESKRDTELTPDERALLFDTEQAAVQTPPATGDSKNMVQLACPLCRQFLTVDSKFIGATGTCNHCGERITLSAD